jgi:hypothetical protein
MKLEKLFKYRDEEEKMQRNTGPTINVRDMPFRPHDVASAVAELANSIQYR